MSRREQAVKLVDRCAHGALPKYLQVGKTKPVYVMLDKL